MMPEEIRVRRARLQDAEAIAALYEEPSVFSGTLQLPQADRESWRQRFETVPDHVFPFVALFEDRVVGNLGLSMITRARQRHIATLGMGVSEAFQGRGVGSALMKAALDLADNWLNLHRIQLEVYTDNDAAIALYRKFGFIEEGRAAAYAFRDGKYVDALLMARLHWPQDPTLKAATEPF